MKKLFDFRFLPKLNGQYQFWPVAIGYYEGLDENGSSAIFTAHGWQNGWTDKGKRIYGWTLHIYKLKIFFGRRK